MIPISNVEAKSHSFFMDSVDFKAVEGKAHMFRGYLSTPTLDLVHDIVTEDCMKDMLAQIRSGINGFAPSLKGDDKHDVIIEKNPMKIPISHITNAILDNKGLFVEGEFNEDHPDFDRYWNMAQKGFLDGLSIEYKPQDFDFSNNARLLKKINLLGYAHAPRPVNPECISEVFVKSMDVALLDFNKKEGDAMPEETKAEAEPKPSENETAEEKKTEPAVEKEVAGEAKAAEPEVKAEAQVAEKPTEVKAEPKALTEAEIKSLIVEQLKSYQPTNLPLTQETGNTEVKSNIGFTDLVARLIQR